MNNTEDEDMFPCCEKSDLSWYQLDWSSMTNLDMNDSLLSPDVVFMLPMPSEVLASLYMATGN